MRLLCDPERVTTTALRLFLRLCVDYDLRAFRAIHVHPLVERYSLTYIEIQKALAKLVVVGILEEGPVIQRPRSNNLVSTYRIRAAYLLSESDLREHYREVSAMYARESLAATS